MTEDQAAEMLAPMGPVDILITHSPPLGVVDRHACLGSIGSASVRDAVERAQPGLVLCGHIHDCWGMEGRIGKSRVRNLGPRPVWFEI